MKWFGNLDVDEDAGEGSVSLKPWFHRETTTFKMDVLGDWIAELTAEYERISQEVYGDEAERRPDE